VQGRIRIRFTVETNGSFTGAEVLENTVGSDRVAECIVGIMSRMQVQGYDSNTPIQFEIPFDFQPHP